MRALTRLGVGLLATNLLLVYGASVCSQPQHFTESAPWLYVWLPVSIALAPYGVWLIDPTAYIWFVRSEFGVIENLTVSFYYLQSAPV